MIHTLLEPLRHGFMLEAFAVGAVVALACALISCYLVLRGWSLMGDAVSHAVLPGVVLAYVAGLPIALGAFAAGLLCAVATGWIKRNSRVKEDTVMGVVFTGLFALGLVMFTQVETDVHLNHVLLGNLLGIGTSEKVQALVCAGVVLAVVLTRRRDLLLIAFDLPHARAVGLNTGALHFTFLALIAAVTVAALQAVGIILTVAMLITPGCTARLLTDRFDRTLTLAGGSAVASALFGVYLSYHIDGESGSCIVLVQGGFFALALLFGKHGLLAAGRARRKGSPAGPIEHARE